LAMSVVEKLCARGDRIRGVFSGRAPVPKLTTARSRQPLGLESTEKGSSC
jgi:hypothetical protein